MDQVPQLQHVEFGWDHRLHFFMGTKISLNLQNNKQFNMGNILYLIAVILVIAWLIGYFGYAAGGLIHLLLILAVVSILLNVIGGRSRRI